MLQPSHAGARVPKKLVIGDGQDSMNEIEHLYGFQDEPYLVGNMIDR